LASNVNIKFLHTEHLVKVELIELKLNFFATVSLLVKVHKKILMKLPLSRKKIWSSKFIA
jgi:hypothetical protein